MTTLTTRAATTIPHGVQAKEIRRQLAGRLLDQLDKLMPQIEAEVWLNSDRDYTASIVTAFTIMIGSGQRVMFLPKGGDS